MLANNKLNYISDDQVRSLVSFRNAVTVTEQAFKDYFLGKNKMPKKVYLDLPEYNGDFRAMPAYNSQYNIAGVKWVNSHKFNAQFNLPSVRAMMIINDPKTATPLAILEASEITNLRTGASGALSVKYLTENKPLNIVCIGAGRQAYYQIMCINEVRRINSIILIDTNKLTAEKLKQELTNNFNISINIKSEIKNNLKNSDVIISSTPSTKPLIFSQDVSNNVLINAIGADAPGKQEIDHELLKKSLVVVDDKDQAIHSGEINTAITAGKFSKDNIYTSIGELIVNNNFKDFQRVKVFDSTGLSIQDLALAGFILTES